VKKACLILVVAITLVLLLPCVKAAESNAEGIEEFNNFKHFDRRENLIHILTELIPELQHLPEDPAYVKKEEMITWGYELRLPHEEPDEGYRESIRAMIRSMTESTVFTIDGVPVPHDKWHYSDAYFFKAYDHDGDGPGDGDGDGIGDLGPSYLWAFRCSAKLTTGTHIWTYVDPYMGRSDSGTVVVS